ncbi:MAG: HAMP domain-containing protein [Anaerolineaceae bacterium]|nr:HAMP domain-containing protein [Anaerolineaceae bacterium]
MNRLFANVSLGVKLNFLVLLVLVILLVGIVLLLKQNTQNLTEVIGGQRITEEANIIRSRLAEIEDGLGVNINFLVSSVSFFQAVGRRDQVETNEIITRANASLKLDDITVVDGDDKRLVDTQVDEDQAEEDKLLSRALAGDESTALLIEKNSGQIEISIAIAAPIVSSNGNILGAIQIGRHISDKFLEDLTFGRADISLGLIYDDKIQARTFPDGQDDISTHVLSNGIAFEADSVSLAQSGQSVILNHLVLGDGGVPHTLAYIPILSDSGTSPAVIMIQVELKDIYSFQNVTLLNTIIIFAALTLIALAIIYINIFRTMISPLNKLKTIAHTMTSGQYDERAPVNTKDEVGQMAEAFNEMANAIQQREISLQAAREQAERADKVKSMFLASVSHELRTPLNAIINLTKFVMIGLYGPVNSEQVDTLGKVERSSKHLLNLINDVLDISKIESGSLELFVEDGLKINDIIRLAVETGRGLLANKPIEIVLDLDQELPPLRGDEQRIRQIILNLVSNSCKFTDEGQIVVKSYQEKQEVVISICDSGPGIDPKHHETIFEVFRQTKVGLRKSEGTGLGLPISRRLTEAHHGRLWVNSALGQGATFYVALPISSCLELTV